MSELPSTFREQLSTLLPDDGYTITADEVMASAEAEHAEGRLRPHTAPAMPRRRVRGLTPALAWMLALIVLAAVGIGVGVGVGGTAHLNTATGATSKLSDYLHLDQTRIAAGQSINGSLVVHNPGKTINLTPRTREVGGQTVAGCQPSLFVELYRGSFSQQIYVPNPCDQDPLPLEHGTTRLPVTVMTTYGICSPSGPASTNEPRCLASGRPPPLPPGTYMAKAGWTGSVPLPKPKAVALTLVATTPRPSSAETACRTSDVDARVTSSGSEASQPFLIIAVTNNGPRCSIDGYPRILAASGYNAFRGGTAGPLPIAVSDGADYEHPDPGPHPVTLTRGGTASFALGTNTASGTVFTITALSITLPGSISFLKVPLDGGGGASAFTGKPIHLEVTAFVRGSAGPPTG